MKILGIIAAGLSSRMLGKPKHLCEINNIPNILNTIRKAKHYFDEIYVILNKQLAYDLKQKTETICKCINNVNVIYIESGKGDADAILKFIKYLDVNNIHSDLLTLCWGDAYFKNYDTFKYMSAIDINQLKIPILAGVSIDTSPYAWFDVDNNLKIVKSHFKKYDGDIDYGIHDQSIFSVNRDIFNCLLHNYAIDLGYDGNNYIKTDNNEMGLLNFITWLSDTYKNINNSYLASIINLAKDSVVSFNTPEELENLNKLIKYESSSN